MPPPPATRIDLPSSLFIRCLQPHCARSSRRSPVGVPNERQLLHGDEPRNRGAVGAGLDPERRDAPEELAERDAQLPPGEVGAQAAVRAGDERQVPVRRAIEAEAARVLELGRIVVGRGDQALNHLALLDLHAWSSWSTLAM